MEGLDHDDSVLIENKGGREGALWGLTKELAAGLELLRQA